MSEPHAGMVLGFVQSREAWYSASVHAHWDHDRDQLLIGEYYPRAGGGTSGEFSIEWSTIGGESTPEISMYEDSWLLLRRHPRLFLALANLVEGDPDPPPTRAQVVAALLGAGLVDLTERIQEPRE